MKKIVTIALTIAIISISCNQKKKEDMKAPNAKQIPHDLTIHDDTRTDMYYWMNDRENSEVTAYLEAENTYTKKVLKSTEELQEKLFAEITGRIKKDDATVPYKHNGFWYFTEYSGDSEYAVYCRKSSFEEKEHEIILDINELAKGYEFYDDSYFTVSPDNKMIAFGEDTLSRRLYTLRFKNLETGEFLDDKIPGTNGTAAWASDNTTVFYTLKDPVTLRTYKVMKHRLGDDIKNDKVIFEEKDETFSTTVYTGRSNRHIYIFSSSTMSTELRFLDASKPDNNFVVFEPRKRGHEYFVVEGIDRFYIRSNSKAKNFRVLETPFTKTRKENWKEVISHNDKVLIEGVTAFNNYLVTDERFDGISRLKVKNLKSEEEYFIKMDEEVYVVYSFDNYELNSNEIRYAYSSLTTPQSVFSYNMETGEKNLLKEKEIPGGYNKDNYTTERIFAKATDGTKIPMSLVYKKGMKKDGKSPVLIYGYGSYGVNMDPWFYSSVISLLDRGFVYVIAHVRGGEEMGRYWYEDGKLLRKKNTFTDFIACSNHLINEKYTTSEKLFAMGGSAGGLLMGVIANLEPRLYKGIIAAVPFVDVVTTMLDESIPLTTGEYDEWGDPHKKGYYDYMLSYSPYDNVSKQDYPNMLITAGFHDSQVQYWEPAKWTALLRDMNTSDNVILLHTNMDFGHGGASGRFKRYRETSMEYAFMLWLLDEAK